jgi:hypothetical protein
MKTLGTVLIVVGCLLLAGTPSALMKYNFRSTHDISTAAGGLAITLLFILVGIALRRRSGLNS